MAASFRFGGHPVYALLSRDVRYTRDAAEGLAGVAEPGPGASAPDVAALRGVLDGILAKAPATSPSAIAAADEDRLALAGYLSAPRGLPAPPASLDARTQAAVLDAHRRVARLVGERMLPEAVQALQQLSNAHPDLVALRFQLGTLLARSGRVDAAVDAFSTVAAAWPERVDAAVALADTLRRAGRLEDASTQAAHAVTLAAQGQAADLAAAHAVATFVALDRKDAEAAAEQARLAQEADPGLPLPGFVRGRGLFDKGAFEEALEAFTEAERAASASGAAIPGLHLFQGESLSHLERHAEAESQFKEELRAFPHALEPYVSLATLYRASNREADVERTLAALTQAAPTPEGYALAARVWAALGDRARADQLRADARTRFRGDPSLARIERGARR
jgi:tetratricopeptide (TPR) repeat protein